MSNSPEDSTIESDVPPDHESYVSPLYEPFLDFQDQDDKLFLDKIRRNGSIPCTKISGE